MATRSLRVLRMGMTGTPPRLHGFINVVRVITRGPRSRQQLISRLSKVVLIVVRTSMAAPYKETTVTRAGEMTRTTVFCPLPKLYDRAFPSRLTARDRE